MPARQPIDPELSRQVLELLAQGEKQAAVGRKLGITQPKVSYIQKKAALNGGGTLNREEENGSVSSSEIGLRSFIAKAWQAREDALWSWKAVIAKTTVELEVAVDAANGAATAWLKAAKELERTRK